MSKIRVLDGAWISQPSATLDSPSVVQKSLDGQETLDLLTAWGARPVRSIVCECERDFAAVDAGQQEDVFHHAGHALDGV